MDIKKMVTLQQEYYNTGKTMPLGHRIKALNRIEQTIIRMEPEIEAALKKDLNKSQFESYMTEVGMVLAELKYVKAHLKSWMKEKKVPTPLGQFSARSYVVEEPFGVVLVMSPWNYPFMLCMEPMIGALAAGNCCILKPSDYAPSVSKVIREVIENALPRQYAAVVEGGRAENTKLLDQKFDYIFFTGGVTVGKLVMEKAAANLTPVTLELGGKSPCIVEKSADLKLAAKRLVFGKFLNAGQTCVAPDYLLVQTQVKQEFLKYVEYWVEKMYGKSPSKATGPQSGKYPSIAVERLQNYPKIINERHFKRICNLMKDETVLVGGMWDEHTMQIEPTVLDNVSKDSPIMQEEIFGPILPVLEFGEIKEAEDFIKSRPKPLALYLFTRDKQVEKQITTHISYGGGCINDTIIHLATSRMPFGGVGESGMGSYHGKESFRTFSHQKSIVKKYNWVDLPIRYVPYTRFKEILLRLFLR